MQSIILNLLSGVDRFSDQIVASKGDMFELKNMYPNSLGMLATRLAMNEHQRIGAAWTDVRALLLSRNQSEGAVYCVSGGARLKNQDTVADAGVRLIYGLVAHEDVILNTTNQELAHIQLLDVGADILMLATPNFTPLKCVAPYTTATQVTFTGTPPTEFKPHLACVVQNRVVYACNNYLVWSDRNEPYVVGGSYPLDPLNPTNITALFEVSTFSASGPAAPALIACTEHAAYLVTGAPDETTEAQVNWPSAARLNEPAGCISQSTVVHTSRGVYWCGVDDVWMFNGGTPSRVGTKLRPEIALLPPGLRWKAHAAWNPDSDCYQLALPKEGQSITESYPLGNHWCLDLRQQEPVWFGPMQYIPYKTWTSGGESTGTSVLATDRRAATAPKMYSLVPCRALPPATDINTHLALVRFDNRVNVDAAHLVINEETPDRAPSTAYALGERVVFSHWEWECTTAGTTSASDARTVFAECVEGGSFYLGTNTTTITDGTVVWTSTGLTLDYYHLASLQWRQSAAPRYLPPSMYHNAHVLFDIKGRQYVGENVALDKRPEHLHLTYWSPSGLRIATHLLPWNQGLAAPGISKALNPTSLADIVQAVVQSSERTFQNALLRVPYNERRRAKHVQPRISTRNGFVIGPHNDRLFIHWAGYSTVSGVWPATPTLWTYDSGQLNHQELTFAQLQSLLIAHITAALDYYATLNTSTAHPCEVTLSGFDTTYEHLSVLEYTQGGALFTESQDIDQQWFRLGFYGTKFAGITVTWTAENLRKQLWWASILGGGHGSFELADYLGATGGGVGPVTTEVVRMPSFWYGQQPQSFELAQAQIAYHLHTREVPYL